MGIKYTSDGKKVKEVGKLNKDQYIVQEIFVTESGDEIPSGENFVVDSLHDKPVISWKENKLKEIEERYDKQVKHYDKMIDNLNKRMELAQEKAREKIKCLSAFSKNANNEQLKTLEDYIAGKIKYFVKYCSYSPEIIHLPDNNIEYDCDTYSFGRTRINSMKLVSLFGGSDGRLDFRINTYKDGSGSWYECSYHKSYNGALKALQKYFDKLCKSKIENDTIPNLSNWKKINGFVISDSILHKEKEIKVKLLRKRLEDKLTELEKINIELNEIEKS